MIAREMTSAARAIEPAASSIIMSLAHGLIAEMSVGLTAVAVKPWAKLLMMLEAAGSIALAALVIARAINILK